MSICPEGNAVRCLAIFGLRNNAMNPEVRQRAGTSDREEMNADPPSGGRLYAHYAGNKGRAWDKPSILNKAPRDAGEQRRRSCVHGQVYLCDSAQDTVLVGAGSL